MKVRVAGYAALILAAGILVGCKEKIHVRPEPGPGPGPVVGGPGVTGQVITRGGQPVANLPVQFRRDDGVWRGQTDWRGFYTIAPLPGGRRGHVELDYRGRRYNQRIKTPDGGLVRVDFTVEGGHHPGPGPGPQPGPRRVTVEGRVFRGRQPLPGATVYLALGRWQRKTDCGAGGVYRFDDVPANEKGRVYVIHKAGTTEHRIHTPKRGTVTAPNIVLPPVNPPQAKAAIRGHVRRGPKYLPNATVYLEIPGMGRRETRCGAGGVYTFSDVPPARPGRVYVNHKAGTTEMRVRTPKRGVENVPDIVLPPLK